jgi:hypothetical protein
MKPRRKLGRKPSLRAKLVLSLGSLFVCGLGLLAAEMLCRLFCEVRFQGSSRNLFVSGAYGDSKGNARNIEAVSFGTKIHTDRYGFRVPPGVGRDERADAPALLILGDSVGFGAGVEEEDTFAGRLRLDLPGTVIYNSSVVGYDTYDYKSVVDHFLPDHDEVRAVVLVFCLNDVRPLSARNIDAALDTPAKDPDASRDVVRDVRNLPVIRQLNEFLRSRSKLFLTLKNGLTDPQARYWRGDASLYDGDAPGVARYIRPVEEISSTLKVRGLPFVVIVAPYEFQLRADVVDAETPQRKLAQVFTAAGIDFVDALPEFRRADEDSRELFLPGDPMHLAEPGHRVIRDIIVKMLAEWDWDG